MIAKLITAVCLATLPLIGFSAEANGYLIRDMSFYDGHDGRYLTGLNTSHNYNTFMSGTPIRLQARLTWEGGTYGAPISTSQHAGVAFTQIAAKTTLPNQQGMNLFSHGIGAFVSENGLAMELWFRHTDTQPNMELAKQNAHVWDQTHGRCARAVYPAYSTMPQPGDQGQGGVMCLSPTPGPNGYMTPASHTLRYGYHYWVRITISADVPSGYGTLLAELFEDGGSGPFMVQSGSFGFPLWGMYSPFPLQATEPIYSTVFRSPGSVNEPLVRYFAFDSF
ncbi:hypothetical protein [Alicycliphilus denitrificans]|uniref:hypothetical protein n=1 Tax=Alicycliphilus denitrificans TaxID=179636 RepID=UPI000B1BAE10|nr:hypothetical protein [Alicycliphilus denitrificans]MBN9574480.1 hypothetical protein [Alicycliphilus denitrificans]